MLARSAQMVRLSTFLQPKRLQLFDLAGESRGFAGDLNNQLNCAEVVSNG
jgi:hypothetical protein